MSPSLASTCPSCGAPVAFKTATGAVIVCEYCTTVVARGDLKLEDLGKVAELADTGSVLDLGLRGVHEGKKFELTGRAQNGHSAGGVWDEWYLAYDDGRWGWLAEAQGKLYLTFEKPLHGSVPDWEALRAGEAVPGFEGKDRLVVQEKGTAKRLGARGEIPYRVIPGSEFRFADLSGAGGLFATLDWSGAAPVIYVGREVTLRDLGLANAKLAEREARRVAATKLNCPKCGGPLELKAPDQTERVGCPNCGSLLDVKGSALELLAALEKPRVRPQIKLGAKGVLRGHEVTVLGFMRRSVTIEGDKYYWTEYLLHEAKHGFRWLVESDGNWSWVEPVSAGEVRVTGGTATFKGRSFKQYAAIRATVEDVLGEFYWKVTAGETVSAADYVNAPEMLSREIPVQPGERRRRSRQGPAANDEISWSHGVYLEAPEVAAAFGLPSLPAPRRVAPHQPFKHGAIYRWWAALTLALVVVTCCLVGKATPREVWKSTHELPAIATSVPAQRTIFSEPFELAARQNIRVVATPEGDTGWFYANGELIAQGPSRVVHRFGLPQSWDPPKHGDGALLSSVPAGSYSVKLETSWEKTAAPAKVELSVIQDSPPGPTACAGSFCLISILPLLVALWHLSLSSQRWQDSYFDPEE